MFKLPLLVIGRVCMRPRATQVRKDRCCAAEALREEGRVWTLPDQFVRDCRAALQLLRHTETPPPVNEAGIGE
jgi:hypothetical protein